MILALEFYAAENKESLWSGERMAVRGFGSSSEESTIAIA